MKKQEEVRFCTQCWKPGLPGERRCPLCGAALKKHNPQTLPKSRSFPEIRTASTPVKKQTRRKSYPTHRDFVLFIEENSAYYCAAFKKLNNREHIFCWNWSAFVFAPLWFMYRKMYLQSLLPLAFYILIFLLPEQLAMIPMQLLLHIGCGMVGNYCYQWHVMHGVCKAQQFPEPQKSLFLCRKGGVSAGLSAVLMGLRLIIPFFP